MRGARAVHTLHGVPEELVLEVGRLPGRDPAVPVRQVAYARHVTLRADALLARLGTVVVPSRAFAEYLGAHGFPRRRLRVIPYGITPATAPRTQAATGPLLVGTAANLEYHKGIDLLVEAAARVRTPLRLDVYGTGSQREALQARARSLGIDVTFHGQVTDLRDRLEALDVFVLPTRGDNFPVTLLEAMSAGVAVVATRVGGVPELVGEAGIVVEPESVESLATALDDLAADPERRAELGQAGAARVRARFDARALAGEMVRLYTEIAG
jgi:glycosyltransferase involved in cell wall biosynthesis